MNQTEKRRFWTTARAVSTAAVFLATALAISSCTSADTGRDAATAPTPAANAKKPSVTVTSQRGAQPPQQQQAASDTLRPELLNTEIQSLEGGTFSLADYKNKTIVLDMWATWCGPCRKEVPHLVEIQKEYRAQDVEVIGLTLEDPQTDEAKVRAFAREFAINYKVGWARADFAMEIMRGNGSIPQTFVIAPGGRVVAHYRGYSDAVPDMIRAAIGKAKAVQTSGD